MEKDAEQTKQDGGKESPPVLRAISVAGFKSIGERQRIEIRPLTLLAGANSGGKSSLIQPMLLLKQTLEAPYDPGSLLLDGPNVRFTSTDQLLTKCQNNYGEEAFYVGFEADELEWGFYFGLGSESGLEIKRNSVKAKYFFGGQFNFYADLEKLNKFLSEDITKQELFVWSVKGVKLVRDRFFLRYEATLGRGGRMWLPIPVDEFEHVPDETIIKLLRALIHVPGVRGNPERTYKTTAIGDVFPGTFETYTASLINHWKITKNERLERLGKELEILGLTWKVEAHRLNDTQVELKVARLPQGTQQNTGDLVSIADVGFGVSQTLPVLVALLAANPGQVVYLEQPEIHLHPRAQLALAKVLAEAAQRGVIVIAETHSALLLQGVQTLVAKDELSKDLVKLHWVQRDETGMTKVNSADLDSTGAFGDWPVDFMEVGLQADNEYLSAAEAKLFQQAQ